MSKARNLSKVIVDSSGIVDRDSLDVETVAKTGSYNDLTDKPTVSSGTVTSVAASAGTGISVSGSPITSSGTITITNTAPDQTVALTAGTGISTSGTYPNFTITNSAPDQTVSLTGAGTTAVTGTYPNFTITSNDSATGTVTGVSGAAPISSSGGTTPAISISQATTSTDGYLSSTDWNTFNSKQPAGSYITNGGALGTPSSGTVTNLTGTASININGTVGATTANTGAFTTLSASGVSSFADGTVSLPSITNIGDTNTGIFFPAEDTIAFTEGGTESMRIDSSGNVGIGTSTGITTVSSGLAINNSTAGNYPGLEIQTAGVTRLFLNANNTESYVSSAGTNPLVFYTNSAERMRIDSSGRVTMPFQPAFHATRGTAYNANGTVIVFPDVSVNIGSGYNSSTGRFTAPVAGTYIFLVSFFTNITNAAIDFRITVNGGTVGGNATTGTTTVARDCHAYIIRTVAANDYIEVISQGFGTNIPGGLGIFQTFSGHLIG